MQLGDLISELGIRVARGGASGVRVSDMTEDSRTVVPGSLFVARAGRKSDGRRFAHDAVRAGACAILTDSGADVESFPLGAVLLVCEDVPLATALLAERLHGNPSRSLLLVGVTGTNGKSTVTQLVHQLLNRCGVRCGMIGTVEVDDGREVAPSPMTTPPSIELSRTLATMVETGCRAAVMEVSSHALDQKRADGLSFDAAVFTNLSGDHLDYHGSVEAYVAAKRRLFTLLDAGVGGPAILNADDPVAGSTPAARPVRCGMVDPGACDWFVRRSEPSVEGEWLDLAWAGGRIGARVPLVGGHNAMNALQATAAAWTVLERAGMEPERARRSLEQALTLVRPPRGRLEAVHEEGDDIAVFVDYAHTDDALARSLAAVGSVKPTGSRLWVVFGCGGERDRTKRPRMGLAAVRGADRVVVTSDNPRSESPARIIADVMDGVPREKRDSVTVHIDRDRAILSAIESASPGDVVVIAGKGHETEQVLPDGAGGTVSRWFVDQEFAALGLAERRARAMKASGTGLVV